MKYTLLEILKWLSEDSDRVAISKQSKYRVKSGNLQYFSNVFKGWKNFIWSVDKIITHTSWEKIEPKRILYRRPVKIDENVWGMDPFWHSSKESFMDMNKGFLGYGPWETMEEPMIEEK